MSSVLIQEGELIPLSLVLDDKNELMFPRASLYAPNGNLIVRLPLVHKDRGVYTDYSYPMPVTHDNISVLYEVFTDSGFTKEAQYWPDLVVLNKDKGTSAVVVALNAAIASNSQFKASVDSDDGSVIVASDDPGASVASESIKASTDSDDLKVNTDTSTLKAKVDDDNLQADKVD